MLSETVLKNLGIQGLCDDSRKVNPGDLFFAMPGEQAEEFARTALSKGAVAIVGETEAPADLSSKWILVPSVKEERASAAKIFYRDPFSKLRTHAITGTNGKTTSAFLMEAMLSSDGRKTALVGTICKKIGDKVIASNLTTPGILELYAFGADAVNAGCTDFVMEASSHSLHQGRVQGIAYKSALFSNLTEDHLDYHKTFENYRDAKKAFFDGLAKETFAITNADDKNGSVMVQNCKAKIKTYSTRSMADFRARIIECHFEGMYLEIDGREVGVQFIGKFNVSNLLAVYGAAIMLGKKAEDILVILSTLKSVAGRLEPIRSKEGVTAIVDYAHTPDALENVLNAIHEVLDGKGGEVIINDMLAGLNAQQKKKTISITDRKEAIRTACMMANKGDVILIAGKGHEDYQEIKGVKYHMDERELIQEILEAIVALIGEGIDAWLHFLHGAYGIDLIAKHPHATNDEYGQYGYKCHA